MSLIQNISQKLYALAKNPSSAKVMVGFDGYVDIIQKVVQSSSAQEKTFCLSLDHLGRQISAAAGKSAQIELRTFTTKLGGNAPIMANALAQLGVPNYCVGMMGYPEIHEVFQNMHDRCEVLSVGQPALTNALEFDDGKLILSEVSTFDDLDLASIFNLKGRNYLDKALQESKLIAMVDWSNLPKCSALWQGVRNEVERLDLRDKIFFFDLCDPTKKTAAEIREVLQVISRFKSIGTAVLGLNENEAIKVFNALSGDKDNPVKTALNLTEIAQEIYAFMDIDLLLVHPVDRSITVSKKGTLELKGKVIEKPKILTGGGDNLNAGFCLGLMNGFDVEECMMLGMATSGSYVQQGVSPALDDLVKFLREF